MCICVKTTGAAACKSLRRERPVKLTSPCATARLRQRRSFVRMPLKQLNKTSCFGILSNTPLTEDCKTVLHRPSYFYHQVPTFSPYGSVLCMRSKAWLASRVSLRLARLPRTASSAQRSRRLRSRRRTAPVLLAHAEVTKNIIFFNGSKT